METFELISSETLLFEVQKTPNIHRKHYVLNVLNKGRVFISLNDDIKKRARALNKIGIKTVDVLHLACAEAAAADYFGTCDDKFLKKAKALTDNNGCFTTIAFQINILAERPDRFWKPVRSENFYFSEKL